MKLGVVLFQLGGPDSPRAVRPFLRNLFNDPDIFDIPLGALLRPLLSRLIASRRAPRVEQLYREIGGGSPIGKTTRAQADALQRALSNECECKVVIAMRYWKPFTADALRELTAFNPAAVVLLPLYPHYSGTTTGSSFQEWKRQVARAGVRLPRTFRIDSFPTDAGYIEALCERIGERLEAFEAARRNRVHLLFSAHGLPVRNVKRGDPYKDQIEETVAAVMSTGKFENPFSLAFQSRVGPMKWLEPFTQDEIDRLAGAGTRKLLVVPVSFVSDHLETLHELGIEIRAHAHAAGIESYEVIEALNESPRFIDALKQLVLNRLAAEDLS